MIITYLGHEFVKVQFGDLTLAFNPPSKDSKQKSAKFGADIVLETISHPDMAGGDDMVYGDRKPFIVSGPGEYETKSIFIKAIAGKTNYDAVESLNTIYSLSVDNIDILYLGAQSGDLPAGISDVVDSVDVLFIPIGGSDEGVFSPKEAYKIAMNLDPKVIIPIHFKSTKDESLKAFIKEAGGEAAFTDKLTIKRKDIEGKEGEIIVLEPQV